VLYYAAELLWLQKLPTMNTHNLFISLGVRVLVRGRVLCTILLCSEMERVDECFQGITRRRWSICFSTFRWERPRTFKVLLRRAECRLSWYVVREEVPDFFQAVLKVLKLFRSDRFEDDLETVFNISFANSN